MNHTSAPGTPPWPEDLEYPRYSDSEYAARWQMLRSLLHAERASHAIVAGHGAGRAELQFLSNAPVRWESLLIVPAEDQHPPRLLVQLDNHAAGMAPWSIVPVEVTGPNIAAHAASLVSDTHETSRKVALLGPLSARLDGALRAELKGTTVANLGQAFTASRMTKSPEELRWTRYGAALCDAAVQAFVEQARPGLREDELGAIMTSAVAAAGGQLGICFMATASMADGGSAAPNQQWSRRTTGPGDIATFELSAGFGGATGQVLRSVSLGDVPTARIVELHEIAERTFADVFAAIEPGLPVVELERIGGRIDAAGFTVIDDLVHGYGGGYLAPHVRTPATRREDPGGATLAVGQLLVIQPNVVTTDHRHGVQTGELVEVTAAGAVSMHNAPRGLLQVESGGSI